MILDDQWDWTRNEHSGIPPEHSRHWWNQLEDYIFTGHSVTDDPEEPRTSVWDKWD